MSTQTTILVQPGPDEYNRLAADARRRGVPPDALARDLLRASLPADEDDTADARRAGLEALKHFAELRAVLRREGYPSVKSEKLVREGRDELEARLDP